MEQIVWHQLSYAKDKLYDFTEVLRTNSSKYDDELHKIYLNINSDIDNKLLMITAEFGFSDKTIPICERYFELLDKMIQYEIIIRRMFYEKLISINFQPLQGLVKN